MDYSAIINALLIVGGTGLLIGLLLGVAAIVFKVEVNEKEIQIRDCLPGNNCGGCGYAGCDALAKAIADGKAAANACPVGGANVAQAIGKITGEEVSLVKKYATVKCAGTCEKAKDKYIYSGSKDCVDAVAITGAGAKSCTYGCLGLGSCIKVCDFGAISIIDGIANIDKDKCVSCGKCVNICPKQLIEIIPYESTYVVKCNSKDAGKLVKAQCQAGCIGCKICEKNCPSNAITVTDNIAHIDQTLCTGCGVCEQKCPVKIITLV